MLAEEIKHLILSKHSLICINTTEESRCSDDIVEYARSIRMNIGIWTFASGMKFIDVEQNTTEIIDDVMADPTAILKRVRLANSDTIFILKDYHSFLKDVEVVRLLKDVIQTITGHYSPIIMLMPTTKLPIEIQKEAVVVDYTLPTSEEIEYVVDSILSCLKKEVINGTKAQVINACRGLTMVEIENALMKSIVTADGLDPSVIILEKKQIIKKNGILEYIEAQETMNNIGGMNRLKGWLHQRGLAFSPEAQRFGLRRPKGLVLLGVPGCGKSLACKALSNMWKMPLLRLDVGAIMSQTVGSSEENVRNVLAVVGACQPCILWIDEVEKGLSGYASSNYSDAGTTARVFATILTWLQDRKEDVFTIVTSNGISTLPPEFLRAGRFDDIFFVDLPDVDERQQIFNIHLAKVRRDPSKFDTYAFAMESDGFSGSEIEESIMSALYDTFSKDMGTVDISDAVIIKALRERVPLSRTKQKEIEELRRHAREIAKPSS